MIRRGGGREGIGSIIGSSALIHHLNYHAVTHILESSIVMNTRKRHLLYLASSLYLHR